MIRSSVEERVEHRPATGVIVTRQPPMATTTLCVGLARGSRHDPPGRHGAAHLFEHLVMSAGGRGSVATLVERRGGYSNATTGNEATLYYARVPEADAEATARALAAAVDHPEVTEEDLERERGVVLQELAAAAADPMDSVQEAFLAALFGDHPLGRPVGGSPEHLAAFDLADVQRYQDASADLRRCVAVVGAGADDHLAALLAGGGAGGTGGNGRADDASPGGIPAVASADGRLPRWPDEEFCWVVVGGLGAARGDDRLHAYTVLSALLGGSPASLAYDALRNEAGLSYAFQSWASAYDDAGAWRVLMGVEPRNASRAVGIVVELLERLAATGPTREELAVAVRQAEGELLRDTEDPLRYAVDAVLGSGLGRLPWSVDRQRRGLRAVDPDDVRRAAHDVLDTRRVVVRPEEQA